MSRAAAKNYTDENGSLEVVLATSGLTTAGRLVVNQTLQATAEPPGALKEFRLGWHSNVTDETTNHSRNATLLINVRPPSCYEVFHV